MASTPPQFRQQVSVGSSATDGSFVYVKVQAIDPGNKIGHCIDALGGTYQVTLTRSMGKSAPPVAGEQWIITRQYGDWIFAVSINASTSYVWHSVGATGEPPFQNSWVNYGSSWRTASFTKGVDGIVRLRGLIVGGTINTIFTLPPGYRPAWGEIFSQDTGPSGTAYYARINVLSSGNVNLDGYGPSGNNTFVSLSGITFAGDN